MNENAWEAGVEAVAREIERIERDYLKDTTQAVEDPSDPGEETARYSGKLPKLILSRVEVATPLVESRDGERLTLDQNGGNDGDAVSSAKKDIGRALDYALQRCGPNVFSPQSDEAAHLKFVLSESGPNEVRFLAVAFHHAHRMFERKFGNGEYSREEDPLVFLDNLLVGHIVTLTNADPSTAEFIESFGSLPEPEPISHETAKELDTATERLEPVLEADANIAVGELAKTVEPGKQPSKYVWGVIVQWFSQIWLYLEKAKKHSGLADWIWGILSALFKGGS